VGGLVLLIVGARAAGLRYTLTLNWRSETLRLAARQSLPVLLASTLIHSNIFVDQLVASTLPPGDLSALSYALKLISLPTSVVFVAFSRVVLPHFSEQVVRADWAALRDSVRVHVWAMIGVALALTVGAVLLARPVIGLIFERGRFDARAADLVSTIFIAGALGFVPMGLGFVIPRVFNALQRNELLTAITVFSVCANAALDLLLAPRLGAAGIALSTSLVLAGALAIQLVVLNHILDGFNALGFPSQWHLRLRSFARGRSLS
jgi:putative peptidoglycan lipid II flippase